MIHKKSKLIGGEQYFTTPSGKTTVNISEILRIYAAVDAAVKPGMSEADIDQIIATTVKRLSPN